MALQNFGVYPINVPVLLLKDATKIRATPKAYLLSIPVRLWGENDPLSSSPNPTALEVWFPASMIHKMYGGSLYYVASSFVEKKEKEIAKDKGARLVQILVGGATTIRVPGNRYMRPY